MRTNPPFTTARKAVAAVALSLALVFSASGVAANAAKPTKPGGGGGDGGGGTSELAIPKSMAAAGDSISVALNHNLTCAVFGGCSSASWTTGTNTTVDSHFLRLKDHNKRITSRNAAFSGATMADLQGQFAKILANSFKPGYLTVLIGANDLCSATTPEGLTTAAAFEEQFTRAMNALYSGSPDTSVFVGSIPNLEQLYTLLNGNKSATDTWAQYKICPLMLDPNSASRGLVMERLGEFNGILERVCDGFAATKANSCKYDGGKVFSYSFKTTDVSTVDFFHPSTTGQKNLAAITWGVSFWPSR